MVEKILIVEDDPHAREAMSAFFHGLGYDLRSTDSAEDALQLTDRYQPNILITDWMLAGKIDGVDLARRLQRRYPKLSIILITAYPRQDISRASAGLAVLTVLEKPFSLHQLNFAVERASIT